jgi:YcfA-like protein.
MKISELKRLLRKSGCELNKNLKRHEEWINIKTGQKAVVPRHDSQEIPTGTTNRIMSDLGIK